MGDAARQTILCLSSYFKGNRFLERCRREGRRVYLLTVESVRESPWARHALDDCFVLPSFADRRAVLNTVAYLMRTLPFDCLVALDDYDVELAASLREHFRLPGLGETAARLFRDKLAMRRRALECGLPQPEFTAVFPHEAVRRFLAEVPGPWLLKPRLEASSVGIRKAADPAEVWSHLDALGDDQSFYLLERFVPGELYHVDSLVADGRVVFAEVGRYHRPLLEVYQGGGIFASRTEPRDRPEVQALRELNDRVLTGFGLPRGCSHTEFLRDRDTGQFHFLETSARVGGASLSDMVEAATGLNLWEEWARVEIEAGGAYRLPPARADYAGVIVSLARQERPDTSGFTDPEICFRLDQKHHVGLVVRSPDPARVEALLDDYRQRIARDFHASLPPASRATA